MEVNLKRQETKQTGIGVDKTPTTSAPKTVVADPDGSLWNSEGHPIPTGLRWTEFPKKLTGRSVWGGDGGGGVAGQLASKARDWGWTFGVKLAGTNGDEFFGVFYGGDGETIGALNLGEVAAVMAKGDRAVMDQFLQDSFEQFQKDQNARG